MSKLASFVVSALVAAGAGACAPRLPSATSATKESSAEASIYTVVANVAHHIDAKRWRQLTDLFAAEVNTDYTSLFGGEPVTQSNEALIAGWRRALNGVITQHHLGPITVDVDRDNATAQCTVRGHHFVENAPGGPIWMVAGAYDFELVRTEGAWRISKMTLDTFYQTGNTKLLQEAANAQKGASMNKQQLHFESEGDKIVGDLYLPDGVENPPVIVVAGSWTTVKEQMAGTYAARLAQEGFAALAVDARGYGESEGSPQFYESPERKIADYKNAISYLKHSTGSMARELEHSVSALGQATSPKPRPEMTR